MSPGLLMTEEIDSIANALRRRPLPGYRTPVMDNRFGFGEFWTISSPLLEGKGQPGKTFNTQLLVEWAVRDSIGRCY
jgi:hypothetical protein